MATSVFNIKLEGIADVIQALKLVERRFLEVEKRVNATSGRLDKYENNLKGTGQAARTAAKDQTKFNKGLDEFSGRLTIAIQKIISYRLAFGVFREATETFRRVVDITIEMDNRLGDLRKVLFATSSDFAFLEKSAFELGKRFGRSADEVAGSFLVFAQQGLNISQIFSRTEAALSLVSGSTLTMKESVEALTAAANNFGGIFENNVIAIVDKFTKVAAGAPVTAADLANALKSVGAVADSVGITVDELNGIVAAVAEVTRKSGKNIGNSLKTIFARIRRPEVIKQLDQLGVSARINIDTFRPLGDVLRDLQGEWSGLSDVERFNIAVASSGIRRYNDFLALMKNFDRFVETNIQSQLSFGFAQRATEAETEKLSRQFQSLLTSITELGLEIGKAGLVDILLAITSAVAGLAQALKGSASTIINVNITLAALAGLFIGKRGIIALASSAGNVLRLGFGASLSSLVPVLGAAVIAFNALFLVLDRNDRAAKRLGDAYTEAQKKLEGLRQEAAKEQGGDALGKLASQKSIRIFSAEIEAAEAELLKLNESINTITLQDLGNLLTDFDGLKSIITQSGAAGEIFGNLITERSAAAAVQVQILAGRIRQANAEIRQLRGEDVLPEELQAGELTRIQVALKTVDDLLKTISQESIQEAISEGRQIRFPGTEDLKVIRDLLGEPLEAQFINPKDVAALTKLRVILATTFGDLESRNEKVRKSISNTVDEAVEKTIRLARSVDAATIAFSKIVRGVNNINTRLETTRFLANQFGQAFNPVLFRANELANALRQAEDTNQKFVDSFEDLRIKAVRAGIDIEKTREVGKIQLDRELTQQEKSIGLREDLVKLSEKLIKADRERIISEQTIVRIRERFNALLARETDELQRIRNLIIGNKFDLLEENSITNQQISILRTVRGTLTNIAGSRSQVIGTIQKQLALDEKISRIQLSQEIRENTAIINNKLLNDEIKQNKAEQELLLRNTEAQRKNEQRILDLRLKSTAALIQQNQSVRQEISQTIAGGLSNLPFAFAERKQAEEELAVRRLELEDQLQEARTANDQTAINRALQGLAELEQEGRRIGSVLEDVFNVFAGVAELRLQKLSEIITEQLLSIGSPKEGIDIGEFLADDLLQGTTEGALQFKDSVVTGATVGAAIHSTAVLEAIILGTQFHAGAITDAQARTELANSLLEAHNSGASRLQQSLNAAFQFGSVLLGQAIGGGGRGAATGASLGGLLGGAFGAEFLGALGASGGPLGILGGSVLGGLLGGLFDKAPESISNLSDSLDRNTQAIENNNRLLELRREFINAPTRFVAPATQGEFGGGLGPVSIRININESGNAASTAQEVVTAIDNAFDNSVNNSGARTPFGR